MVLVRSDYSDHMSQELLCRFSVTLQSNATFCSLRRGSVRLRSTATQLSFPYLRFLQMPSSHLDYKLMNDHVSPASGVYQYL